MSDQRSYDVIVLGAGAGGMTAAALCAADGLRVLVLERSSHVGGTTAISGGMVWIPANSKMQAAGLDDDLARAELYLSRIVPPLGGENLRAAFLANGDKAIATLEARTSVKLRPVKVYPDYYPDEPGATHGGRVLEPVPFDGRALGQSFSLLRPPLPEFTLFGGMMLDRADIPHFRKAGRSLTSARRVASLLARHARQRMFARRGTSLYLGNALAARLLHSLLRLNVEIETDARVTELTSDAGKVTGVAVERAGHREIIRAGRAVVLATGGFSHAPHLRAAYLPAPAGPYSSACPTNRGEGLELALARGGVMRTGTNNAFWVPVSVFRRADGAAAVFPHTVTDRAKPGAIVVDQHGRRYVNEALSYHEFVQAMFRADQAGGAIPSFLICDSRFLWKYGLGAVKPFSIRLRRHLRSGYLVRAHTLQELARKLRVPAENLVETVSVFNDAAATGSDPAFGRGGDAYQRHLGDAEHAPNPCVAAIEAAPYYAVALHPGDLGTAAGLLTSEHGQVLDRDGRWIENLYACGNDMSSIMNGAYPGPGITLGSALTFGFLVAQHIASAAPAGVDLARAPGTRL